MHAETQLVNPPTSKVALATQASAATTSHVDTWAEPMHRALDIDVPAALCCQRSKWIHASIHPLDGTLTFIPRLGVTTWPPSCCTLCGARWSGAS